MFSQIWTEYCSQLAVYSAIDSHALLGSQNQKFLRLLIWVSVAQGAASGGPTLEQTLEAAGLEDYLPRFKAYGVTTFALATALEKEDLADPDIGMNEFDQQTFARTMDGIDKHP